MDKYSLLNILNELDLYKHEKSYLIQTYISHRLEQSLEEYYRRLNQSVTFLKNKNSVKVLRNLNTE